MLYKNFKQGEYKEDWMISKGQILQIFQPRLLSRLNHRKHRPQDRHNNFQQEKSKWQMLDGSYITRRA